MISHYKKIYLVDGMPALLQHQKNLYNLYAPQFDIFKISKLKKSFNNLCLVIGKKKLRNHLLDYPRQLIPIDAIVCDCLLHLMRILFVLSGLFFYDADHNAIIFTVNDRYFEREGLSARHLHIH